MSETAAHKAWVQAHPERRREAQRRWRQKNQTYQAQWHGAHPSYQKTSSRRYRRQRSIERIKARLWELHLQRADGVTPHYGGSSIYRFDSWKVE